MANGSGFQKDGGATGDDVLQPALAALRSQRLERCGADCDRRPEAAATPFPCALRSRLGALDAELSQGRDHAAGGGGRTKRSRDRHPARIALRQTGHADKAVLKLRRATKRKPPYAAAFRELGYLLFSLERHDEAVEVLNRGLEVAPMMPEPSVQLGYVHLRRRNWRSAKTAFGRALLFLRPWGDAPPWHGDGAFRERRACRRRRTFSTLSHQSSRRCEPLAQSWTLPAGARPAGGRLQLLPRGLARRSRPRGRGAQPAGAVKPWPLWLGRARRCDFCATARANAWERGTAGGRRRSRAPMPRALR